CFFSFEQVQGDLVVTLHISGFALANLIWWQIIIAVFGDANTNQVINDLSHELTNWNLPLEPAPLQVPIRICPEGVEHRIKPAVWHMVCHVCPKERQWNVSVMRGCPRFPDLHPTDLETSPLSRRWRLLLDEIPKLQKLRELRDQDIQRRGPSLEILLIII